MSMKPSDSTENMALPVTDPLRDQDGGKLFNGFAMTKRGAYAAISYMSCAVTMESVRGVNVPMYTTLRRTTVVFTMLMEYILAGKRYTSSVVFSVGLIVFGAFIAGARDLSFDAYGYAIVFLSNISTTIYLATIARKTSGLNSFGLMWCNGIICGPFLLIWTLIRGDMKMAINFPYLFSPGFIVFKKEI
ncbi:hypothetical protein K1719_030284 [Acacia pycnantha]|nr:hypothetical protein K1719_030284 [Acacia pycnantha]